MSDASWKSLPVDSDTEFPLNWSPSGRPEGATSYAFFGSSSISELYVSSDWGVGGWTFSSGASDYIFHVGEFTQLDFEGAGITVNGGSVLINNSGDTVFRNSALAGSASFINAINTGHLFFTDGSSLQHAQVDNYGSVSFDKTSRAGLSDASIANRSVASTIKFSENSDAGFASLLVNDGALAFFGASSANHANIFVAGNGAAAFYENSHAANANMTVSDGRALIFTGNSRADHATIRVDGQFSTLAFGPTPASPGTAHGGTAAVTVSNGGQVAIFGKTNPEKMEITIRSSGGLVSFDQASGPAGNHKINIGSLSGFGKFNLSNNQVTVGSTEERMSIFGQIAGKGGSLVKVGNDVLFLGHANNSYTLGTTLKDGTLILAARHAAGAGAITFVTGAQRLQIESTALASNALSNQIKSFGSTGDVIDLADLKFVKGAKAIYHAANHKLVVTSGGHTDTLTLLTPHATHFVAVSDGHHGVKIVASTAAKALSASAASSGQAALSDGAAAGQASTETHKSVLEFGRDKLFGGAGADHFVFNALKDSPAGAGRDVIANFSPAQGDKIDLRTIDADTHHAGNQAFHFIGTTAFHHHDGELRCAGGIIQGDVNGDGKADFEIHVNAAHLVAGDFIL